MRWSVTGALLAALGLLGCGANPDVVRVVDGRLVGGSYVEPEVYASFLRGAIAEETGDLSAALAAYAETAERDGSDPEVWTRIGDVRCRMPGDGAAADRALARALTLDEGYAPAWEARARCALLRARDPAGGLRAAEESARRAAKEDPRAIAPQLVLARAAEAAKDAAGARDRLVALTLVHRESLAAWEALAAWGRAHGDSVLVARALAEAVRHAPSSRRTIGDRAVALAGEGELVAARIVAAAALDADGPRVSEATARLGIDAAILAGDVERVRARATRGHVGLDEVAARALLLGDVRMARALAEPLAAADPRAAGARMVLAAAAASLEPAAFARVFEGARAAQGDVPFVAVAVLAGRLSDAAPADAARSFAAAARYAPPQLGDALASRAGAELAARGVLDGASLPLDARIELAARTRSAPPEPGDAVDPRHRLLALAMLRPQSPEALALARTLESAAPRDAMIATALAKIAIARGTPPDARAAGRLADIDPSDPIAAAAALDVARSRGDAREIVPARNRMTALARTPAERALARE